MTRSVEATPLFGALRVALARTGMHGATAAAVHEAVLAAALTDSASVTVLAEALASYRGKSTRHVAKQLDRLLGNPRFRLESLLRALGRAGADSSAARTFALVRAHDAVDGSEVAVLLRLRPGARSVPIAWLTTPTQGAPELRLFEWLVAAGITDASTRDTFVAQLRGGAIALAGAMIGAGQSFLLFTDTSPKLHWGSSLPTRVDFERTAEERLVQTGVSRCATNARFRTSEVVVPFVTVLDARLRPREDLAALERERAALGAFAERLEAERADPRLAEVHAWWPRYWKAGRVARTPSRRPRTEAGRRPLWPEGRLRLALASSDRSARALLSSSDARDHALDGHERFWSVTPPAGVSSPEPHRRARRERLLALLVGGLQLRLAAEASPSSAVLPR